MRDPLKEFALPANSLIYYGAEQRDVHFNMHCLGIAFLPIIAIHQSQSFVYFRFLDIV